MQRISVLVAQTSFTQFGFAAERGVDVPTDVVDTWDGDTITNRLNSGDIKYEVRLVPDAPTAEVVLPTGETTSQTALVEQFSAILASKNVEALVTFAKDVLKLKLKSDKPFEVLVPTVETALSKLTAPVAPTP